MSRSRQLAAIMFTDIKGYTALMQQNEEKALQARDKHRRIFNASTEKYRGKILQYYGDGTLSIFNSVIDAVHCGIEMQRGFREAPALPVRIGIHSGDIVFSEEEIIGDSVNIASRIESLAVPGSVFISEKVYDEVKNQESIQAVRLKAVRMKNVERPMVVYAIANEGLVVPQAEGLKGKTEDSPPSDKALPQKEGPSFLATKLFVPPPRPKRVHRPRLIERLKEGLHGKLTLISAPAGFGKTTLASEWAASCGRPVAWLSLDEADSDPQRFLSYLIAALQQAESELGKGVLEALQSPQPPLPESVLTALLNEVAAVPQEFLLVLDDYHLIDAQATNEALAFLIEHLPPQLHLLITTREDPRLPLARLRVRGQLTELRAASLRFTPSEAAEFLNQVMGLELSAEDIAALETRTEGWIAGLQLAALSMKGLEDTSSFIQAFTGSHRFILDYLAEEVLHRQPEPIRHFLLQTSILDKLYGPLCDAVTGTKGGKEILEELERGNLFVVPLDNKRQWYRYHHLFREVLLAHSKDKQPEDRNALHLRASEWYEQYDSSADAIRHALAAVASERAAGLIELAWPEMDESFQTATWLAWVKALPKELIHRRPVLLVDYAWALLNKGELEAGMPLLQEAETLLNASPGQAIVIDEEQFQFLPASIATAQAYYSQAVGDMPGSMKYARQALKLLPEDDYLRRGPAAALLGLSYVANGKLEEAYQALAKAMADFQKAGNLLFALSGTFFMADIRIVQGRLQDAAYTIERSLQLVAREEESAIIGTADLYLSLSRLELERGKLEAASRHLRKSEELGEAAGLPDWACRFHVSSACLEEARGKWEEALQLLQEAERLYYPTPVPELRPISALKAQVWLKQGKLAEARAWAQERQLAVDNQLSFLREFEHLTFARLLLAEQRRHTESLAVQKAQKFLERLLEAAEAGGRMGSVAEILALQALAHQEEGETEQALITLERALELAEPEGLARSFLDEGEPMAQLLAKVLAQGSRLEYASGLLAMVKARQAAEKASPPTPPEQPLIEPLSKRELEILQLIAQGLSNQEISERLFLALSTVKGHNRNIFGKLGVQRRTEAVARARELGLI